MTPDGRMFYRARVSWTSPDLTQVRNGKIAEQAMFVIYRCFIHISQSIRREIYRNNFILIQKFTALLII
jgi:hypothetical protein